MASAITTSALAAVALLIAALGLAHVAALVCCVVMRPPQLRSPTPPAPLVFLWRLPTRADRIM